MKAITVKNPWAYLIAQGIKDIENRTWRTNFRGRILIHSSAVPMPHHPLKFMSLEQARVVAGQPSIETFRTLKEKSYSNGFVLCSVEIVDCVKNHQSVWAEEGCWNWVLKDPEPVIEYDGLKIKGSLMIWDMEEKRIIHGN